MEGVAAYFVLMLEPKRGHHFLWGGFHMVVEEGEREDRHVEIKKRSQADRG